MRRNLSRTPKRAYPAGVRIVHNRYPGPDDDPGTDPSVPWRGHRRWGSFRVWITDEPGDEQRCYCGWLDGREHYGTLRWVDADGRLRSIDDAPVR